MADAPSPAPFEAYVGDKPYLFASYAHVDGAVVFPELICLSDQGYRIWYDEGIDPGNEWPEEVAKALAGAAFFVVFVSPNAVKSQNVRNEINFALNNRKPFLAIHVAEAALPPGLQLRMGDIQAIMKYRMTNESYLRKIEKAIPGSIKAQEVPSVVPLPSPLTARKVLKILWNWRYLYLAILVLLVLLSWAPFVNPFSWHRDHADELSELGLESKMHRTIAFDGEPAITSLPDRVATVHTPQGRDLQVTELFLWSNVLGPLQNLTREWPVRTAAGVKLDLPMHEIRTVTVLGHSETNNVTEFSILVRMKSGREYRGAHGYGYGWTCLYVPVPPNLALEEMGALFPSRKLDVQVTQGREFALIDLRDVSRVEFD